MKYLGKIDDIIFDGRFIIRTTFKPKIGVTVVNKHKQKLGTIAQIIGPVKKPYVTIKPVKDLKSTFDLVGTDVYLI
ncbi:H/ACA ribonucleoprotein complex subunit GAR1 [[Eubacterium] cellulosolvens]